VFHCYARKGSRTGEELHVIIMEVFVKLELRYRQWDDHDKNSNSNAYEQPLTTPHPTQLNTQTYTNISSYNHFYIGPPVKLPFQHSHSDNMCITCERRDSIAQLNIAINAGDYDAAKTLIAQGVPWWYPYNTCGNLGRPICMLANDVLSSYQPGDGSIKAMCGLVKFMLEHPLPGGVGASADAVGDMLVCAVVGLMPKGVLVFKF